MRPTCQPLRGALRHCSCRPSRWVACHHPFCRHCSELGRPGRSARGRQAVRAGRVPSAAHLWGPPGACGPRAGACGRGLPTPMPDSSPHSALRRAGRLPAVAPWGRFSSHCRSGPHTRSVSLPYSVFPFSTITAQFISPPAALAQDIHLVFCDFIIPGERWDLIRNSPGFQVYKEGLRLSEWDLWSKFLPPTFSDSFPRPFPRSGDLPYTVTYGQVFYRFPKGRSESTTPPT